MAEFNYAVVVEISHHEEAQQEVAELNEMFGIAPSEMQGPVTTKITYPASSLEDCVTKLAAVVDAKAGDPRYRKITSIATKDPKRTRRYYSQRRRFGYVCLADPI